MKNTVNVILLDIEGNSIFFNPPVIVDIISVCCTHCKTTHNFIKSDRTFTGGYYYFEKELLN